MRQCQQPLSSLFQQPVSETMLTTVKNSIQAAMKQFNKERNMDLEKVSRKIMLIQQRIGSTDGKISVDLIVEKKLGKSV